jgi:hypothetical protein
VPESPARSLAPEGDDAKSESKWASAIKQTATTTELSNLHMSMKRVVGSHISAQACARLETQISARLEQLKKS